MRLLLTKGARRGALRSPLARLYLEVTVGGEASGRTCAGPTPIRHNAWLAREGGGSRCQAGHRGRARAHAGSPACQKSAPRRSRAAATARHARGTSPAPRRVVSTRGGCPAGKPGEGGTHRSAGEALPRSPAKHGSGSPEGCSRQASWPASVAPLAQPRAASGAAAARERSPRSCTFHRRRRNAGALSSWCRLRASAAFASHSRAPRRAVPSSRSPACCLPTTQPQVGSSLRSHLLTCLGQPSGRGSSAPPPTCRFPALAPHSPLHVHLRKGAGVVLYILKLKPAFLSGSSGQRRGISRFSSAVLQPIERKVTNRFCTITPFLGMKTSQDLPKT